MLNEEANFVICVIPSSDKGFHRSGIRIIAERLCEGNIINGSRVIYRKYSVPKKRRGERRSPEEERESLEIQNIDLISNKQVLLLDDITTRGESLDVGEEMLLEVGATLVAKMALGQTVPRNGREPE